MKSDEEIEIRPCYHGRQTDLFDYGVRGLYNIPEIAKDFAEAGLYGNDPEEVARRLEGIKAFDRLLERSDHVSQKTLDTRMTI